MNQCNHPESGSTHRICRHLNLGKFDHFHFRFSGRGSEHAAVCAECRVTPWDELNHVCEQCFRAASSGVFNQCGIVGTPEILVAGEERCSLEMLGTLDFPHAILAGAKWHNRWLILLADRSLHWVDPFGNESERIGQISDPCHLQWTEQLDLITSADGRYAAITNRAGSHGVVWDLNWDRKAMDLNRGGYHAEQTPFPLCFCDKGPDTRIVAATAWNRLDIFNPKNGDCLTPRVIQWNDGEPEPQHYLDYFLGELVLSPDEQTLLVDGWVWHPIGEVRSLNLAAWRAGSKFACEDGLNTGGVRACNYNWNVGKAFLSESRIILWGIGNDAEHMVDGAWVYDLQGRQPIYGFAGPPNTRFVADGWLFCFSPEHDTTAWDIETGERVWQAVGHRAITYNKNFKHFLMWHGKSLQVSRWLPSANG